MRRSLQALSAIALLLALGTAFAHAHLESSEPAHGATVPAGVDSVSLRFTEALEVGFSTFKAFRLDEAVAALGTPVQEPAGAEGHDGGHGEGDDHAHGPAASLDPVTVSEAELLTAAALADPGFVTGLVPVIADPGSGAHSELTLVFAEPLSPGTYVVLWRALSVDTHGADGFVVFEVTD